MVTMTTDYDLCVIGGGAAGLVVAAGGAGLGAKVVLVEKNRLGGDCLYDGCVPSKTLLKSAKVFHQRQAFARYGLPPASGGQGATTASIPAVMQRVQQVITGIEPHDSPERARAGCSVRPSSAPMPERQSPSTPWPWRRR